MLVKAKAVSKHRITRRTKSNEKEGRKRPKEKSGNESSKEDELGNFSLCIKCRVSKRKVGIREENSVTESQSVFTIRKTRGSREQKGKNRKEIGKQL
jgi:hypothetical protein